MASAEQVYAKQVGVGDVVTSTNINPHDSSDVLLDLSSLDVSGFTPDTTDLYASIIDLSGGTATIWNSTSTSLVSGITLESSFLNITGTSGADSLAGNGEKNTINGGGGNARLTDSANNDLLTFSGVTQSALQTQINTDFSSIFEFEDIEVIDFETVEPIDFPPNNDTI